MDAKILRLPLGLKDEELTLDQLAARAISITSTSAGETVTPQTALKSPTVYAIVNRLSSMFAQLPFSIIEDRTQDNRVAHEPQRDHAVTRLIDRRPNQWQTPYQFKAQMMVSLLLNGGFAAFKGRSEGETRFLTPIPLAGAKIELNKRNRMVVTWNENGTQKRAFQDQLLWIASPVTLDGLHPIPATEACKESIALEIAAEKFGATMFGSSAIPHVILTRKGAFTTDEGRSRFKEAWNNLFRKKRGTAVLEGDEWDVHKVQMSNDEAQFLETRKLQRSILAGMFNVPPHMVGDLERATFSNISSQSLEVLMYTLAPWLECIEASINRDLLTEQEVENERLFARFDTKRLMRGDIKSMADFISKLRQWGIISANEGRAMLEMNARDDEEGDEFLTPLNFEITGEEPEEIEEEEIDADTDTDELGIPR